MISNDEFSKRRPGHGDVDIRTRCQRAAAQCSTGARPRRQRPTAAGKRPASPAIRTAFTRQRTMFSKLRSSSLRGALLLASQLADHQWRKPSSLGSRDATSGDRAGQRKS